LTSEEVEEGRFAENYFLQEVQVDQAVVKELREAYENYPFYSKMCDDPGEQFMKNADGLLYDAERRLCVPNGRLRMVLMHDAHDAIVKGHLGFDKCYQDLSRGFTWPSMRRDVQEYVRSCDSCQRNKPRNQSQIGLLNPLEVPNRRLERVTLDFVMEWPRTPSGHDTILVIVDRLSKIVHFVLRRQTWTLLGLQNCSSITGIGIMVFRARLCRIVMEGSMASFGRSCSG
jgi:Integrase zinc binding domain